VSVDWDDYMPYDPGIDRPLHELPRTKARAVYEQMMATKGERIETLKQLLAANGIELDDSDESVQALNDWFRRELEPSPNDPGEPRPLWFGVAHDIGMYLGDLIIERAPGLEWRFFDKDKKEMSYQHPVLMGFDVPNPNYNADIPWVVNIYGYRLLNDAAEGDDDMFVRLVEHSVAQAPKSWRPEH
jgi:Family of unknown function (DUF6278)